MERFIIYIRMNKSRLQYMADKMGVSVGAIHSWKTGKNKPSIKNAIKIEKMTNGFVKLTDWL